MGRPKGSKNKSTLARQAGIKMSVIKLTPAECDKHGNVTKNGQHVGTIDFEDGVFVGKNVVRGKRVVHEDYDQILAWFNH